MLIKAITFDFWNTLYKAPMSKAFLERRINAFKDMFTSFAKEVELDALREAVFATWTKAHLYQREQGLEMGPKGHVDNILQELKIKLEDEEWQKIYELYTSFVLEDPPELNDGVLETLSALQGKYKMAVICNTGVSPGVLLKKIMQKDGIYDYFDYHTFSNELGIAKPNPKIFEFTLEKIAQTAKNAAHIGDDPITDVFGSKRVGMTSIWLAPFSEEKLADADFHLRNFKELLEVINY